MYDLREQFEKFAQSNFKGVDLTRFSESSGQQDSYVTLETDRLWKAFQYAYENNKDRVDNCIMSNQFADRNIRAEHIINIGTMCWDESSWASEVSDAFDQDFPEIFEAIGKEAPDDESKEFLSTYFLDYGLTGFLVKFATPIPQNIQHGVGYTHSWGYYTTHWIYAETYAEACSKAIEWQEEYLEKMLKR